TWKGAARYADYQGEGQPSEYRRAGATAVRATMTMLDTGCASGGTTVPGFVLGFALLPLALGIVTFGRDQPVFRSGTTLVEVSAIVTRDGVPVADLRRSEVRVLDE